MPNAKTKDIVLRKASWVINHNHIYLRKLCHLSFYEIYSFAHILIYLENGLFWLQIWKTPHLLWSGPLFFDSEDTLRWFWQLWHSSISQVRPSRIRSFCLFWENDLRWTAEYKERFYSTRWTKDVQYVCMIQEGPHTLPCATSAKLHFVTQNVLEWTQRPETYFIIRFIEAHKFHPHFHVRSEPPALD